MILDNKGGAYVNGIHFVAGDLHGIDPYDLAKQIDDVAGLNPTAYINAPILTTIAAIPIAVQRIIDSSAKSSNDAAWSAAGSAVGAIEIGGPGGSAVGQFAAGALHKTLSFAYGMAQTLSPANALRDPGALGHAIADKFMTLATTQYKDQFAREWAYLNAAVPIESFVKNIASTASSMSNGDYYNAGAKAAGAVGDGLVIAAAVASVVVPILGEIGLEADALALTADALADGADAAAVTVDVAADVADVAVDAGSAAAEVGGEAGTAADAAADAAGEAIGADATGSESGLPKTVQCHSFAPETPVLLADGQTRPIKDVAVGDKVVATDPTTGTTGPQSVTALHLNHDSDMADVIVGRSDSTSATIHTTAHHLFWDSTLNAWTRAGDLQQGDLLRPTPDQGSTAVVVLAVRLSTAPRDMYDLTVSSIHTYYVVAGDTPILVHNCGSKDFFTVQDANDAERLRAGGEPWPSAPHRTAWGEGVYAFDNQASAERYMSQLVNNRGLDNLEIVKFSVSRSALGNMRSLDIDSLPQSEIDAFMDQHYMADLPSTHGYDYITRGTQYGDEHFFEKSAFGFLGF